MLQPGTTAQGDGPVGGVGVLELVVAALLALGGLRSLVVWMRRTFPAASFAEQALYSAHITARVGLWFAFAAFFVGLALLEEPQGSRWFIVVALALAGVQFLTALALGRSPDRPDRGGPGVRSAGVGNPSTVPNRQDRESRPPGPLEDEKRGETTEPGAPQPEAAEVESARLLANQAREQLAREGLSNEQIRRLADDFVAEDRGEDLEGFIRWARERASG
jgi:hypothetical protein